MPGGQKARGRFPPISREPEKSQLPGKKEAEKAPASGTARAEDLSLSLIRDNWDKIRQEVRVKSPATEALLNSCKSIGVKNGELVLGFASEFVKSKMDTNENSPSRPGDFGSY